MLGYIEENIYGMGGEKNKNEYIRNLHKDINGFSKR